MLAVLLAALTLPASSAGDAAPAPATYGGDAGRTGWYPSQPRLAPGIVAGGTFGKLFSTTVDGQVYAQPLSRAACSWSRPRTTTSTASTRRPGTQLWSRALGHALERRRTSAAATSRPRSASPATPVIDRPPARSTSRSKTYASGTAAAYLYMHALDLATGAERAGFPVVDRRRREQRAERRRSTPKHGSSSARACCCIERRRLRRLRRHCDRRRTLGWVVGVSTAGTITTRYVDPHAERHGAGIWQSGGGLVSDGAGQILFSDRQRGRAAAASRRRRRPPISARRSCARVQPDGSLQATDFFAPVRRPDSSTAGTPTSAPAAPIGAARRQFGTASHPHLAGAVRQEGYVYLLDRDDLGGSAQGAGGGDASLAADRPLRRRLGAPGRLAGRRRLGLRTRPGPTARPTSTARVGSAPTRPASTRRATPRSRSRPRAPIACGFSSSAGVVTSDGTDLGVGARCGRSGRRAAPAPARSCAPTTPCRWPAAACCASARRSGRRAKFALPGVGDGRVYVGTRDGHVLGFGAPVEQPARAPAPGLPGDHDRSTGAADRDAHRPHGRHRHGDLAAPVRPSRPRHRTRRCPRTSRPATSSTSPSRSRRPPRASSPAVSTSQPRSAPSRSSSRASAARRSRISTPRPRR